MCVRENPAGQKDGCNIVSRVLVQKNASMPSVAARLSASLAAELTGPLTSSLDADSFPTRALPERAVNQCFPGAVPISSTILGLMAIVLATTYLHELYVSCGGRPLLANHDKAWASVFD